MAPRRGGTVAAAEQNCATKYHHDDVCSYGDEKSEQRKNDERNAGLRKHSGEIGDRQRLPEENAAIASLTVKSLETIKDGDEKSGCHDGKCDKHVWLRDEFVLLHRLERTHMGR